MTFAVRSIVLVLLVLALFAPASAQYTNSYGYSFNNPISATANSIFWDKMNSRLIYRMMLKKRGYTDAQLGQMSTEQMLAILGGPKQAQTAAAAPVQSPATAFRRSSRNLLLPAMAQSLSEDREQQNALLEIFEQGLQAYDKEASSSGLTNDVAGSIAYLIASCYYVFNDGLEPDENGTELLARALQNTMNTAEFRAVADADKQKFYELMVGLGTFMLVSYQQAAAANDADWVAQLKSGASEALKGFLKLDPSRVRITANGLEISAQTP